MIEVAMQDNWVSGQRDKGQSNYSAQPWGCELTILRSFEYLAATEEMGFTKVPGKDSFTRALIYALEALVEERADGRFTTVELLNKIKDAPHFPKDQNPMLINREKNYSAGRIMLHPLKGNGSDVELSRKEAAKLDPLKGHALTLHFDFSEKPSSTYLEMLGRELNDFFERNLGINQVRWGGMRQALGVRSQKFSKPESDEIGMKV